MNELKVKTNSTGSSLLKVLQENYTDWMHACGGKGRCTTCKCKIVEGQSNLSIPSANEDRFFKLNQLVANERLACQALLLGGVVQIEVPDEYKLPHVTYSY